MKLFKSIINYLKENQFSDYKKKINNPELPQYRIKVIHNYLGQGRTVYFPQVKHENKEGWQKIGRHVNGFGLYPEHSQHFPRTKLEAELIINDYHTAFIADIPDIAEQKIEYENVYPTHHS